MSEARVPHNKADINEQYLIDNYDKMTQRELAEKLGVTREAINHRAIGLGLRKINKEFVREDGEEIVELLKYPGYAVTSKHRVVKLSNNTLIKPKVRSGEYTKVVLWADGKKKYVNLHRILAESFIPNPKNLPQVNHIDGDKSNYSLGNLEWVTPRENAIHAIRLGLKRS